nr:hypothetical protein [Tanacetum cinerariifolium]
MEQYMSKTRADYGSGVARPKIENKDTFELKGQFLKELRTNTFSGSDHEDANEHIEKVLEIVDLFHIPNITIDQVMLRAFPMSLTGATSHWLRNKPTGIPTRKILDSRVAIPSKTTADAKIAIQEMAEYPQKWHNRTSKSRKEIDQDSAYMVAASKVPMLKPGEFEIWRMRIEQYIQMMDYDLWEVIENGATLPKTQVVKGVTTVMPITSAEEKA